VSRLEETVASAAAQVPDLSTRFAKVERRLRRQLAKYQLTIDVVAGVDPEVVSGPTFGTAAATAIETELDTLERRLGEAKSDEPEQVHEARISAKRLRYVLEPVVSAEPLVDRLKALQDRLGELCDARVAERELAEAVETAAAERARKLFDTAVENADAALPRRRDQRAGLVALARGARARWKKGFVRLKAEWLEGRTQPFLDDARALAAALAGASSTPHSAAAATDRGGAADPWPRLPSGAARRRRRRTPRSAE
jgi:hypothetical protein